MTNTQHVFISYSRQDGLEFAERLEQALEARHIKTWRDKRNLDPNQDFTAELEKAIEEASHVVVCVTPDIKRENSFVRREIQYAVLSDKIIVPLRLADMVPPIHVVNLTFIDFFRSNWDLAFAELVKRLQEAAAHYETPALPSDPHREYLNALYQSIVRYLDKTVFSLIALNTETTPDAVETSRENPPPALPMAFFDVLLDDTPSDEQTPQANFHSAFDQYEKRMLLLGEPGSGKTTTLMAYARDAVAKRLEDVDQPLPLLAPVSTWDSQNAPAISDWLATQIHALKTGVIAETIQSGKALLLLDGLDELGSRREDEQTKESYDPRLRFIERIPSNNALLVTCRQKDYAEIGQKISLNGAVTLQPLNNQQMRAYLTRQPDLLAAIESDADLREMAQTPLILSLFTFAFSDMSAEAAKLRDLAHTPSDLRDRIFETYVRRRYEREVRKPYAEIPFTLEEIYEVLGGIATKSVARDAISSDSTMLSMADFSGELGAEKAEAFVQLVSELHLLVPDTLNSWRFIHAMIRSYFAFRWALKRVEDTGFPSAIRRRSAYALAWLKDPRRSYEVLAEAFHNRDQDLKVRSEIVFALGHLGDKRAVDLLIEGLEDPDVMIRFQAATALGRIGDGRAFNPVLPLLKDEAEYGRYGAVRALGDLGDINAVPHLIPLLQDTVDFVRASTARSLGELRAAEAVVALKTSLHDSDPTVCRCAAVALEQIGTPEALSAVEAWQIQQKRDRK